MRSNEKLREPPAERIVCAQRAGTCYASTVAVSVVGLCVLGGLIGCGPWPGTDPSNVAPAAGAPEAAASESDAVAGSSARGPYLRVVGTVQDGGLPHAACNCERCELARLPGHERWIASLAVVLPESRKVFLIDATPDVREQLARLADVRDSPGGRVDRAPIDGVLLTHAHVGHYLGLAFFGFEAVHTRGLPVFASHRMGEFLRHHGPWSQLVDLGNVEIHEVTPGQGFELGDGVRATALPVPHRDELSDTVGFFVEGAERRVLYVPDTDVWEKWDPPLSERLRGVDVAILDGSFFSLDELPGRDVSSTGHPLMTQSMDLLEALVAAGEVEVYFTHLNHSNPALVPDSEARRAVEERGFHVLAEGQEIEL